MDKGHPKVRAKNGHFNVSSLIDKDTHQEEHIVKALTAAGHPDKFGIHADLLSLY